MMLMLVCAYSFPEAETAESKFVMELSLILLLCYSEQSFKAEHRQDIYAQNTPGSLNH